MQPNLQFEGKSSVFNKIQRNGKYNGAGEHIVVLRIIPSTGKCDKWQEK